MGLLDGLLGNASEIDKEKVEEDFAPIMADGEHFELALKVIRDMYLFTNKRLLLVDKQGVTGKRTEYHSIPYKSIAHYAVITSGHFDLDGELQIWTANSAEPITKEIKGGETLVNLQKALATYVG
ncbi:PH domain-containing protein [Maricurvus nonylphenolicus]|uniref:PH domain-containing protein n=1 Tax=Maricurvus nonylphenolicus TaxID=1008307 RepID=UPI0036F1A4C0